MSEFKPQLVRSVFRKAYLAAIGRSLLLQAKEFMVRNGGHRDGVIATHHNRRSVMEQPWRRTIDGRGALQAEPGIIRGPGEADLGRVRCPRDLQAQRCGREGHVIAIATDVAEA